MRVELPGKVGFHQPVEELDVLRQRRGELIGRAVLIGRCDRADEFAVIERVVDTRAGEICFQRRKKDVIAEMSAADCVRNITESWPMDSSCQRYSSTSYFTVGRYLYSSELFSDME